MNVLAVNNRVRMRWSLRARLMWLLGIATTGLWVLAVMSTYQHAKWQSEQLFDDSLRDMAQLILAVVAHEMSERGAEYAGQVMDTAELAGEHDLSFQVWDRNGQLIYHSPTAPTTPMLSRQSMGYMNGVRGGMQFRAFVLWNVGRTLQIQIVDPLSRRTQVLNAMLWRMLLFGGLFLLTTLALIAWIVMRSFTPLRSISADVAKRGDQYLDDVDTCHAPREVVPLLQAINQLLGRVRDALTYERRFTADAAHELRTPLAALRAHAQVLQGARSTGEAQEATRDMIASVDRSGHLLDQLLALARIDQCLTERQTRQHVDLSELAQQQLLEHAPLAQQRNITLTGQLAPAQVTGNIGQLHILLRNLLDNALRYTPQGGAVVLSCGTDAQGAWLAVHDNGVGIPESQRQRVFERFYRINNLQSGHTFGSGLGLSIVQRLAQQHGARIDIEDGLQGRGVGFVVRFAPV